jgi:hypothetical protein
MEQAIESRLVRVTTSKRAAAFKIFGQQFPETFFSPRYLETIVN